VADVAARRAHHAAHLAGAVRREVVVVHEALRLLHPDAVDDLLVADRAKGRHAQHLGLTPGEKTGAMRARQHADLTRDRPDLGQPAAVGADALLEDRVADRLFLHRIEELRDWLLFAAARRHLREQALLHRFDRGLTGRLVWVEDRFA
jgi:hypothetical protein